MNRDFEIRQLLRAYRSGIMSEAAFEEAMTELEHESGEQQPAEPRGFEVGGRAYRSEREAVLSFLDELHATQMDSAIGFAKWSAVCRTSGLRTGLVIAAEREAYHARVIQRRMHELGGELRSTASAHGGQLVELLANASISDLEKLTALTSLIQDPQQAVGPLLQFAQALTRDIETKQALRLIAEDELSSANWLHEICAALTALQAGAQAAAPASAAQQTPRPPGEGTN
jgi:hypothetical protein